MFLMVANSCELAGVHDAILKHPRTHLLLHQPSRVRRQVVFYTQVISLMGGSDCEAIGVAAATRSTGIDVQPPIHVVWSCHVE